MAVGHSIRQRELLESAGACRLNDTYVCYVVRHHSIEANAHLVALTAVDIMRSQNAVCDSVLAGLIGGHTLIVVADFISVEEIDSMIDKFHHNVNVFRFSKYKVSNYLRFNVVCVNKID